MVSSALYRKIDDEHRAAFSTKIIDEMLRKDLGFSGIVISMIWRLPLCELSRPMSAPPLHSGRRRPADHRRREPGDHHGRCDRGRGLGRPGFRQAGYGERSTRSGHEGAPRPPTADLSDAESGPMTASDSDKSAVWSAVDLELRQGVAGRLHERAWCQVSMRSRDLTGCQPRQSPR